MHGCRSRTAQCAWGPGVPSYNWSRGWGEVGQDCAESGRWGLRKRFPRTGEGWPGSLAVGTESLKVLLAVRQPEDLVRGSGALAMPCSHGPAFTI